MKAKIKLRFLLIVISLTFIKSAQVKTNNCFTSCFASDNDLSTKSYCNYNGVGYCCDLTQVDSICTTNGTFCSKGAANQNISYAYCLRSTFCNSSGTTIYAAYYDQTIRATGFRYNFNRPCYWKITTNNSISSSDFYKITIHFTFATAVRIYTGSALGVANNVVVGQTGYYYKFPIYDDNIQTTIWIVANPDNQNFYDPDLLFSYEVGRDDDVQASVNIGIEPWQVGLLGVGLCVIALSVSCVIAKWVCKLGVPKYKPWEPNKDFYPKQEREAHKNSKGLVKNQDYETYRDNLQSTTQFGDSNFTSGNLMNSKTDTTISNNLKKGSVIPIGH